MKGAQTYSSMFGDSVSAGDIDKDGYDDIIIGAPRKNMLVGEAYVIYGGPTTSLSNIDLATIALDPSTTGFKITPSSVSYNFGTSVSTADINNDGYSDIIIGVERENLSKGAVYVIYGGPRLSRSNIDLSLTALNPLTTGFRISAIDTPVESVNSAGDIDKDGYDDIIIGNPGRNGPEAVFIIYGGEKSSMRDIDLSVTPLDPSTTGFMITGYATGDHLGSVSSAGDIDKDGYDDVIIGAIEKSNYKGAAYVIYGGPRSSMRDIDLSATPLNPLTTGFKIARGVVNDGFAMSVSSAGDFNNDGYADIVIGSPGNSASTFGAAYVVYGGPKSSMSNIDLSTPLNPQTKGLMIRGNAAGDVFGTEVRNAGDINKDGYDDVVIGAPANGLNYRGAIYVIYGGAQSSRSNIDLSSLALDPLTTGFSILGTLDNGMMGYSVSAADINNDEHSDLIFSAPSIEKVHLILAQCPKNCDTCSSASTCDVCLQGYDLRNSLCYPCPINCDTCRVSTSCDACTLPYLLYSGKCLATCPPSKTFASNGRCIDCPIGCSQCTSLSTCQSCTDGYMLTESQVCKKTTTEVEEKDIEKTAAGIFEGTFLVGAALGSGNSLALNFGLGTKFLRNIKYMKIPVSSDLQEAFISWKMPSDWISAPKSWSLKYSSKELPGVFSRYGLQSAFLMNFWKPLILALIGLAVFGVFKLIEVSMDQKSMVFTIVKQVNIAASSFALIQFYGNLDDVIFYFTIEMRSTEFETGFRICSSVIAIGLLLVGGLFIALHWTMIRKYQKAKEPNSSLQLESFVSRFANLSLIFKDFKDKNSFIQSFLMINVIRSVLSSLIFATLFEHPLVQISLLIALNILMIVYLGWKRSFKELVNTLGQIFCEVALLVAHVCVFILALSVQNESNPIISVDTLSKCIIIVNFVLLFGCTILLIVSMGKMLYKSYLERRKTQPVFPKENNLSASNQRLSTNSGLINQSQSILQSDRNPLKTVPDDNDQQQGNSNNYFIRNRMRNQNLTGGFDISSANIEEIEEANQSNRPSHSRLRELAFSRTAQGSKMKDSFTNQSPESKIQDPSFHSKMIIHEESTS